MVGQSSSSSEQRQTQSSRASHSISFRGLLTMAGAEDTMVDRGSKTCTSSSISDNDSVGTLSSTKKSGSFSSMLSLGTNYTESTLKQTYAAAVDKAAQYFPSRRSLFSSATPEISRVRFTVVIRRDSHSPMPHEDTELTVPASVSIKELRKLCAEETGVRMSSQRLFVEEHPLRLTPSNRLGFVSRLRCTANQLSRKERMREMLIDYVNFIFLPEAVNREVRGKGIVSWFQEQVLPHLQAPPPLHVAWVSVLMQGGRRSKVELSATATLWRLKESIEKQNGIPAERQSIVIVEQAEMGMPAKLFWTVARYAFEAGCGIFKVVAFWMKWIFLGIADEQTIQLRLERSQGEGPPINVSVRADMTLAQLRHMVQLQHGDDVNLEGLVLAGDSLLEKESIVRK